VSKLRLIPEGRTRVSRGKSSWMITGHRMNWMVVGMVPLLWLPPQNMPEMRNWRVMLQDPLNAKGLPS
jgi:hypothetical protein